MNGVEQGSLFYQQQDKDVRWWENKKLYKSSVIWDKQKTLGHPFVMYYNANGDTSNNTPKWRWFRKDWYGVSDDMISWQALSNRSGCSS
jgi:hypothetical protein